MSKYLNADEMAMLILAQKPELTDEDLGYDSSEGTYDPNAVDEFAALISYESVGNNGWIHVDEWTDGDHKTDTQNE
jgi:predicted HAD superfamily hydrolase